ncbi:MAG: helix-turn-helix domain-containing protein [Gemmatimonadaceae bacterium]|jgi:AraC-like DNA-binding protein
MISTLKGITIAVAACIIVVAATVRPAGAQRAPDANRSIQAQPGTSSALAAVLTRSCKDCELTLPDLAARLDTTTHKLSEVLNARIGQTFYDFVNAYRVHEVQRRIRAGEARALKMLALAMDAGFASKSTFNDVFKKHTNQTPSRYRQAVGG